MAQKKDLTGNKWLRGLDQNTIAFASNAELVQAMSAPEYKTDPAYRDVVTRMIQNGMEMDATEAAGSNAVPQQGFITGQQLNAAMYPKEDARKIQDMEIFIEQRNKMFGDPRYSTSPTYRREVEDWLKANSEAIERLPGYNLIDRNQHKGAFRVELGTDGDTAEGIREGIRQTKIEKARAAAEEAKTEIDRRVNGEIDEVNATRKAE